MGKDMFVRTAQLNRIFENRERPFLKDFVLQIKELYKWLKG